MGDRDEAVEALLGASRQLVAVAVRSMDASPVEVTVTGHRILWLLHLHGELRVGDLAGLLGVHRSNATRHCDRLERSGLVARQRSDQDGRAVEVTLTDQGAEVLAAVTEARRLDLAGIVERLPEARLPEVVTALRLISEAAEQPPTGADAIPVAWEDRRP